MKQCRQSPVLLNGSNSHSTPLSSRRLRSSPKLSATRERAPSAPTRKRQANPDSLRFSRFSGGPLSDDVCPGGLLSGDPTPRKLSPNRTSAPERRVSSTR